MRRLLVLLALIGVAGCGGEALVAEDQERIERAGDQLAKEDTYAADIVFDVDADEAGFGLDGRIRGASDQSTSAFEGKMDLPEVGEVNVTFLGVGKDLFLKGDGKLGEQIPAGKAWIRVDQDTQPLGFEEFLDFLRAGEDFENRGEEDIDGTPTTHYGGPIDAEDLAREGGIADEFTRQLGGADVDAEVDVWLSDDDLLVQMEFVMEISADDESAKFDASMTNVEFGVDVDDIKAPPAAKVAAG